ncbi:2,5-diamino-6-(ribosylamino)-4(3H)-pyrimidinone 5'-phosphate reductase [Arachnomyces sp. PD_36]|nr:2,5-diamino-6-(ribosylamino)-4(3H)-pyrimidinone 5'-phosphate reductase [Arachnomyces sp. PD_36]
MGDEVVATTEVSGKQPEKDREGQAVPAQDGAEDDHGSASDYMDEGEEDSILQKDIQAQIDAEIEDDRSGRLHGDADLNAHAQGSSAQESAKHQGPNGDANTQPAPAGSDQESPAASGGIYSVYENVPPNIARIRQLMFEVRDPIELTVEEFDTFWPWVDNVWLKKRSYSGVSSSTSNYRCRLCRSRVRPPRAELAEGKKPRVRTARERGDCKMQIKVVHVEGPSPSVTITQTANSGRNHNHDLDNLDKIKRNSGIMELARKESVKGYLPSSIYAKFTEEPDRLLATGGKFFTAWDVRNVYSRWRWQNRDVKLRPHEGYKYVHGFGIIKVSDNMSQTTPASHRPPHLTGTAASAAASEPVVTTQRTSTLPPDALKFPDFSLDFLNPYLANLGETRPAPHVTLSYACSLDSKISLTPGAQTILSGPESKLMTHYLRSRHEAIIIGVGTAMADDPSLNCRLEGAGGFGGLGKLWQPRPVIIDPHGRWPVHEESKLIKAAKAGRGKGPWIVVSPAARIETKKIELLKSCGGDFLRIVEYYQGWRLRWEAILRALASEKIRSVMIEGGGTVLSELLNPEYTDFIDSVVITVAPTFLGRNGVNVSPDSKVDPSGKPIAALSPREVTWQPLGVNMIMCGKIRVPPSARAPVPPPVTEPANPTLSGIEEAARDGGP